jgi:ribonucleoside-diphosphate reductase alpha chain
VTPSQRLREVARRLRGIGGSSSWGFGADRARSLPDALARVLDTFLEHQPASANGHTNGVVAEAVPSAQLALPLASTGEFCLDCANGLVFEEGASKCLHCGLVR